MTMADKLAKYVEYVKRKFPQIQVTNVGFNLTDGNHSDVVIINDEHIFKFAKYDWTACYLANQCKITSFVSEYIDTRLPKMELIEDGAVKCDFIKGAPLTRDQILKLSIGDQNHIARQIGSFLRQLHAVPLKAAKFYKIGDAQVDITKENVLSEIRDIKRKIYPYCDSLSQKTIDENLEVVLSDKNFLKYTPAVIHANPNPAAFIFDKETKKLNGVIGFGFSGIGDPAYDLGVILECYGEVFLKRVAKYYGDMSNLISRARFYAYFNGLMWAKRTADMITTRDFSKFRFYQCAKDCMPVGSPW